MKKLIIIFIFVCQLLVNPIFADEFDDFENEYEQESTNEIYDPLYRYNKFTTQLNFALYNMSLRPLGDIYKTFTPHFVRKGVNNFFHNLESPLRFVTLFFSFKFKESAKEFATFVGNTTIGVGGLFRPFKYHKDSDFGLMLARWGVPAGPHIVLPFLGPANIRDAAMLPFNYASDASLYLSSGAKIGLLSKVNKAYNARVLIDEAYSNINPYVLIRDFYEQSRKDME